ncbi:SRPBCC family protein [Kytococcus sedentarius]|uniref:SRPBCC family protein n=1 Tax=Kytococcus sedentarius TaxID=1276 RepID=UPI0035BC4AD5
MRIRESVTVHAPAHEVFERVRDLDRATQTIGDITHIELLEGPARMEVGTRWRETRTMMGHEAVEEMWVTELVEDSHYVVEAESDGAHYTSGYSVAPVGTAHGEATRLTFDFSAEALTRSARVMSVLMRPMARLMAKQCRADLLDIKASLEG